MLKDVLVNLSVADGRDPACEYAMSVAKAFNAHLTGIAIAYDPTVPAIAGGCEVMLPGWVEEERGKAAERASSQLRSSKQQRSARGCQRRHACSTRLWARPPISSRRSREASIFRLCGKTIRNDRNMRT